MFGVSNNRKKLWIVTELFYPEETSTSYILTKIANKLCEKYEVHVICGPSSYEKTVIESSSDNRLNKDVNVHRVSNVKLDKNNLFLRIIRFFLLSLQLSHLLARNVKKEDKVLIVTNPAPLLIAASILKKKIGFHLSILVHDVFPENTIPAGIFKSPRHPLYRLCKTVFDKAYCCADKLIVLGRDMQEIIQKKINKADSSVIIIENWADIVNIHAEERDTWAKEPYNPADQIHIQYAGNLGRVQGLMTLLKIIKEADNPALRFWFIGNGAAKKDMVNYVKEHNLTNVSFNGNYKRDEQNKVLNVCDLSLVTLAEGMYGLGVPSKSYNIMAAGKPILFIGDKNSEIGLLIQEKEIGYIFSSENKAEICSFFQNLSLNNLKQLSEMGKKARVVAERHFSETIILNKYLEIL